MNSTSECADYVVELLAGVGRVVARQMFGGYGLYCDGVMFALIADDVLYLKADEANRPDFERAESAPFVYDARGRSRPAPREVRRISRGKPARLLRRFRERQSCAFATHARLSPPQRAR